ncbi:MAG: hypothetical protein AW12_01774 [Candidatus Accumulibacter sp. BA-94]|nr:MAG: hypothetical protein AW12_01774 [Candidatus Accumulibacter sp. BA-94]
MSGESIFIAIGKPICSARSKASVGVCATIVCATGILKARRMAFDSISESSLRRSCSTASISIFAPSVSGRECLDEGAGVCSSSFWFQ